MTSQVNLVHPGGEAQRPHRDYHLGFQSKEVLHNFPTHAHYISNYLTLQGAIAHVDITIESGQTKILPFSQLYKQGWFAWRYEEFIKYFEENFVQLPLNKGDSMFFSPALFHAAGTNTTDSFERMANLLQVSSPFGRTMETINRKDMLKILFPTLSKIYKNKEMIESDIFASIYACAEGYAWPTNLDFDPPTPETQQSLFIKALKQNWTNEEFLKGLDKLTKNQSA
jgi:ectoine hydroxylase-related dioxygenase (phytanoyl-CoA dioxygenase family)